MPERKSPARKGPTRAAALKALGLTAEEFKALQLAAKELAEIRAHGTSEGDPLPPNASDPQATLEDRSAPPSDQGQVPSLPQEAAWYVRNLRNVDVGFRLTRQQKQGEKRTNLKPRGSRGDMVKLETADLRDTELQTQVGYGLVEVIPEGEALEALKKQYTNAGTQIPAHIAMLRNERGEEYKLPVRTVTDEEAMGYTVQELNPDLMTGKLSDKQIKRDAGFAQPQNAQNVAHLGGNPAIISDGFMNPVQQDMGADNEKQAEVDARLRAKQFEDRPEDNLGVKVTVEPTQRLQ